VGGTAIGWVRFDPLEGHNEFLVSISVAPESRSKGMGSMLLGLALRQLRVSCGEPVVYAKVKDSNVGSLKVFEKHGFKKYEDEGVLHTLILSN
jgi:ribosomal protein S18 acetylase RimI-like enzyme